MFVLLVRVLLALVPPRLDGRELWRNLYKMGVQSVPIVMLTAVFAGGIMVIQAAMYVRRFNAYSMVGWGAGYSTFREVGPILIGLMFSGRVGSNNAAGNRHVPLPATRCGPAARNRSFQAASARIPQDRACVPPS